MTVFYKYSNTTYWDGKRNPNLNTSQYNYILAEDIYAKRQWVVHEKMLPSNLQINVLLNAT